MSLRLHHSWSMDEPPQQYQAQYIVLIVREIFDLQIFVHELTHGILGGILIYDDQDGCF